MTGFPVSPGELVDTTWLNATGARLLYDSVDAGVSLPVATITTPSLSQAYKHLLVVWNARSSNASAADSLAMRWNGVSTANYYDQFIQGVNATPTAGTAVTATSGRMGTAAAASAGNAAEAGCGLVLFPAYKDTTFFKYYVSVSGFMNGTTAGQMGIQTFTGIFASGTAITTQTFLLPSGANFVAGSRFSVYGMA